MVAALYDIEATTHTCGQPLTESASWAADADNPDRSIFYTVESPGRCHACTVLNRAKKTHDGDKNEHHDPAHLWAVTREQI